jgi:hypothetical protein
MHINTQSHFKCQKIFKIFENPLGDKNLLQHFLHIIKWNCMFKEFVIC